MKTVVIIGFLLLGFSGQAISMGHPHNVFAARKQMRTKTVLVNKPKGTGLCWQPSEKSERTNVAQRLVSAMSYLRPFRLYSLLTLNQ